MVNTKYRTWIEVSNAAIRNNYKTFRDLVGPDTKMLGVVKSNAYGHELFGFAKTLAALGIDWLGVDSITEANALRRHGVKIPILVLGYTLPANFNQAHSNKIALTVSSFESLMLIAKRGLRIPIHLKIDSGMHRQGFCLQDLEEVIDIIKNHPKISLQGMYTHFAAAKRPDSAHTTEKQVKVFKQAVDMIRATNPDLIVHASATAGTLNYPEARFDMVRVGIGLYGLWPSKETKTALEKELKLIPVLTWKTMISEVKTIEKGEKIGYDYTERLGRTSRLAVLPIGYWHGYWRAWSSKAYVVVKGQKAKVVGRVAMDMVVIDVTDIKDAKVGDEVVLLGSQSQANVTADELADLAGTTCYEVVTRLNPLIKKFYV